MDGHEGVTLRPIGFFRSGANRKYAVPRQGVMNPGRPGAIELLPGNGFEIATQDLEGIERIWIIFLFHGNAGWSPLAHPPVTPPGRGRIGVFATRSPYRPNPVGLTCSLLLSVEPLRLVIDETDMIDGTPILDIKPYIPKIDSFPNAKSGWIDEQSPDEWVVAESPLFREQAAAIVAWQGPDLAAAARVQLCENPFDFSRKRVALDGAGGTLSLRMFRLRFAVDEAARTITLESIYSGYTLDELADTASDPYDDKGIHRAFVARWP